MRGVRGIQRGVLIAWVGALGAGQAAAQWDLSSSVGLQASYSENANYGSRASSTPRDPNTVEKTGDTVTYLRLMGSALRTGQRSRFSVSYAPNAVWFGDLTNLNRVAHLANGRVEWNLTARSTLSAGSTFNYTPEQGATANTFTSPVVLTSYADRRFSTSTMRYRHQFSDISDLTAEFRYRIQAFGDPSGSDPSRSNRSLVDSRGPTAMLRFHRELNARVGFDVTGTYSRGRFDRHVSTLIDPNTPDDPNAWIEERLFRTTDVGSARGGVRLVLTPSVNASLALGGNLVMPVETATPEAWASQVTRKTLKTRERLASRNRRAWRVSASIDWGGRFLRARGGYNQGLSAGSGTFGVSRTRSAYAGLAATLHRRLAANLLVNQTYSSAVRERGRRQVDTWTRGGFLTFNFTQTLSGNLGMRRQAQDSNQRGAPDLSFNTYSLALMAVFN